MATINEEIYDTIDKYVLCLTVMDGGSERKVEGWGRLDFFQRLIKSIICRSFLLRRLNPEILGPTWGPGRDISDRPCRL